jgi:hypothetical protein
MMLLPREVHKGKRSAEAEREQIGDFAAGASLARIL